MSAERDRPRVNWTDAERRAYTNLALVLIGWLALAIAAALDDSGASLWILAAIWAPFVVLCGWAARQTSRLATSSVPDAAAGRAAFVAQLPGTVAMCALGIWILVRERTVVGVLFLVVGVGQLGAMLRSRQALR